MVAYPLGWIVEIEIACFSKLRPAKKCGQQPAVSHDRRNGRHGNDAGGHQLSNRHGFRGALPHGHNLGRERAFSRVRRNCDLACISRDSLSLLRCDDRLRDRRGGDGGGHREGNPCGRCASQPCVHNLGRAHGYEYLGAGDEFQTWFTPLQCGVCRYALSRSAALIEAAMPIPNSATH